MGGGAHKTSLDSTLKNPNKSKRFFTPLIASSLALALSASIASAAPCGSGNAPQICWNGEQFKRDDLKLTTQRGYFKPEHIDGTTSTPIENLYFSFEYKPNTEWDANTKTYSIFAPANASNPQHFVLDGKDRGLVLGANGTGTLALEFKFQENPRDFYLKLDKVQSGNFSLMGNITIFAGEERTDGARNDVKFTADFNKNMIGNITSKPTHNHDNWWFVNYRQMIYNFKGGASLKGNLDNGTGHNKLNFDNGNIEGNIVANNSRYGNNFAINTITFKGSDNRITGGINANGGTNNINANGTLTIIAPTLSGGGSTISATGGYTGRNNITAKNLIIDNDGIIATGNNNSKNANILTATNNANIKTTSIDNALGKLTITAKNLSLQTGLIKANGSSSDVPRTHNKILITGSGDIQVGEVVSASSMNTFSVSNGGYGSITITDSLSTNYGANTFMAERGAIMFNLGANATITAQSSGQNRIVLKQGGKFLTANDKLTFQELFFDKVQFDENQAGQNTLAQSNAIVDLATGGRDLLALEDRKDFRLLTIGEDPTANANGNDGGSANGLRGNNGLFRVYVNNSGDATQNKLGGVSASGGTNDTYGYAYSDRILIKRVSNIPSDGNTATTQYIQVLFDKDTDLSKIAYSGGDTTKEGNIAIFTTKNSTITDADGKPLPLVSLKAVDSILGFEQVQTSITSETTDANGKAPTSSTTDTYTTYFLTSAKNQGVSLANQKTTSSALGNNYMLYLANLNSLNKRMGELRENTHTHGTWARVFNGMQSTNFSNALDTRSIYTTLQGGYDYSLGLKGASNTLGFALSYANSISKSGVTKELDGSEKGIKHAFSNAFELAIYNAYVQDGASKATGWKNGLYTDSIVKFSYISSDLNLFGEGSNKTTNLAFTLSQEIGYRFLLGSDREFYIDPQGEITLGYLNQSNLKQTLAGHNLLGVQDAIMTLRSRIGSSYGYKFDKFTQNKGFNSSLYLGTYFVSDFIVGGDVHLVSTSNQALSLSPLASTARFVLNLGTNFKIKDNTRIYFDFERSFGGKITTDYQLNLGVRYSFGTSKYTPYTETTQEAPKDNNTLKEVEPTQGYYIEVLEKEANKLTAKEKKVLEKLKDNLKVQSKTQGNKTMKVYLVGAYKDEAKAKEGKAKLDGVLKELKSKGNIIEVE